MAWKTSFSFTIFLLAVAGLLLQPIQAESQEGTDENSQLAWIYNQQLWLSSGGEVAEPIAEGDFLGAALSPQQTRIAAVTQTELMVFDTQSQELLLSLSPEEENTGFLNPAWVDDDTLLFNTIEYAPEEFPGFTLREDLQRLTVSDETLTQLAADGEGGWPFPNPENRQQIAVMQAGEWDSEEDGRIMLWDAEGNELAEPVTFEAVGTGSSEKWYPVVQWENSRLAYAIPEPEAMNVLMAGDLPMTDICVWEIQTAPQCSTVVMAFPPQPAWNPSLNRIAYTQPDSDPDDNLLRIVVQDVVTASEVVMFAGSSAFPQPIMWLDEDTLLYQEAGRRAPNLYSYSLAESRLGGWPGADVPVLNLQQLDEDTYAVVTGDFSQMAVEIFDAQSAEFSTIAEYENGGLVTFAIR
jgi:hypothetical protein